MERGFEGRYTGSKKMRGNIYIYIHMRQREREWVVDKKVFWLDIDSD